MNGWKIISEIARTILIMSVTGSVIVMFFFAIKPLYKNRLPKSTQYYLWVLILVALLVPFSTFISIPVNTSITSIQKIIKENVKTTPEIREELAQERYHISYDELDASQQIEIAFKEIGLMKGEFNNYVLFTLITIGAVVFFIDFFQYLIFIIKLRGRRLLAEKNEMELLKQICGDGKIPRLYRNPLALTPMLIGIFSPVIYLPNIKYSEVQLKNILLHELTHLRRHDIIIKWAAALAVHIHWFNPIVYFMRREIDRACELSCDEAVIKNFDNDGKQDYGDTLIAMASETKRSKMIVSTTMCEEKKTLKERLSAIMKHKKFSIGAIVVSCVLLITVLGSTIVLGAESIHSNVDISIKTN